MALDLRDKLMENAENLFALNGYIGTKVKDITDSSDVSKGSFYNKFKNKEEILLEIFKRNMSRHDKGRDKLLEQDLKDEDKLLELIQYELDFYMKNKKHYALVFRVMSGEKLKIKRVVKHHISRMIDETKLIADILEGLLKKGKIGKCYKDRLLDIANIYNSTIQDHLFYLIGKNIGHFKNGDINMTNGFVKEFLRSLTELKIDTRKEAEFIFEIFYNGLENKI